MVAVARPLAGRLRAERGLRSAVVGGGGPLGPWSVLDVNSNGCIPLGDDCLIMPDRSAHNHNECPAGVALTTGETLEWTSDESYEGDRWWEWTPRE